MAKFENDKYYTPLEICQKCYSFIKPHLENTNLLIEPSVGSGNFLKVFDLPYEAYDLYPDNSSITKMDWLKYTTSTNSNEIAVIGNPPYGDTSGGSVLLKFIIKSMEIADIVGFVLPSNWANSTTDFNTHAIVDSLQLGKIPFSSVGTNEVKLLDVCFCVFKRIKDGKPKINNFKYSSVKGIEYFNVRRNKIRDKRLDSLDESWSGIVAWGSSTGKILKHTEADSHANTIWFKSSEELLNFFEGYDWHLERFTTTVPGILVKEFLSVLVENGLAYIE